MEDWEERINQEEKLVALFYRVFLCIRILCYLLVTNSIYIRGGFLYTIIYIHVTIAIEVIIYLVVRLLYEGKLHLHSNSALRRIIRYFK